MVLDVESVVDKEEHPKGLLLNVVAVDTRSRDPDWWPGYGRNWSSSIAIGFEKTVTVCLLREEKSKTY